MTDWCESYPDGIERSDLAPIVEITEPEIPFNLPVAVPLHYALE
jgi:hypothetical protein